MTLYQDAFEVVNPRGSAKKKHKMLGVCFTLAKFDAFHRSTVDNFCAEKLISYILAMRRFFSQLIADLRELERNGLNVHGNIAKAPVFCIAGDNLG